MLGMGAVVLLGSTEMLVDSMILDKAGGGVGYFSSDPEVNPTMYMPTLLKNGSPHSFHIPRME